MKTQQGLLLVGHGTRDDQGQREFLTTASQLRELTNSLRIEHCFLELASPTIAEGVAAAYGAGVRRLRIVPLLLFAAGHAKRDIPAAVEQAMAGHQGLQLEGMADALQCHSAIVWLSELRYRQSLCGRAMVPPRETALVMIGRGSSDAEATQCMRRFCELRRQRTPVAHLEVGFIAVQKPTLEEAVSAALRSGCRRVVLQPHLLFQGELMQQVCQAAAEAASSGREIIVVPHLAPGWPLARALADRAGVAW